MLAQSTANWSFCLCRLALCCKHIIFLQLNWQLGSPVLGVVLRKWAPHDTYKIWKRGAQIRVDGTLLGMERHSSGLLPEWKRGSFSLLFNGNMSPPKVQELFNNKHLAVWSILGSANWVGTCCRPGILDWVSQVGISALFRMTLEILFVSDTMISESLVLRFF